MFPIRCLRFQDSTKGGTIAWLSAPYGHVIEGRNARTTMARPAVDSPPLALITGGIVFSMRRRIFRHRYSFLDAGLIFGGIALGCFGLRDYSDYLCQGDYKFSRNVWKSYEAPESFLEPMKGDEGKYEEVKAYTGQIEPISNRPEGNLHLVVSIRDNEIKEGVSACHIIRSRLEFPGSGPLGPSATQLSGSRFQDSDAHQWSLRKLRKNMKCVLRVAFGKTAKVRCSLLLQVKEE